MRRILPFLFLALLLAACRGNSTESAPAQTEQAQPSAAVSNTPGQPTLPPTPTATAVPAALKVNGEIVPLSEYQASLSQLEQAQPNLEPAQRQKQALTELEDQTLLAQAAYQGGFSLDDAALQARIDALAGQMGGAQALADWQQKMGYDADSFRSALRRAAAAAWMRDQIANAVPAEAEQIHARQILLRTEETANQVEAQAKVPGTNFATLAAGYDLVTRGDLSWFPRGYLNEPAVEEGAFALQPGEISPVIHSGIGYHILQVIAREVRPLSPDARLVLQRKALAAKLDELRKSAQIEILVSQS